VAYCGRERVVLRAAAEGLLLNGRRFEEALVEPGDCLTLGETRVEFARARNLDGAGEPDPLACLADVQERPAQMDRPRPHDPRTTQDLVARLARADGRRDELRRHVRKLRKRQRRFHRLAAAFEHRWAARARSLARREHDLALAVACWRSPPTGAPRSADTGPATEMPADAPAFRADLEAALASLTRDRVEFLTQQQQAEERLAAMAQSVAEKLEALQASEAALRAGREILDRQREDDAAAWHDANCAWTERVEAIERQIARLDAALVAPIQPDHAMRDEVLRLEQAWSEHRQTIEGQMAVADQRLETIATQQASRWEDQALIHGRLTDEVRHVERRLDSLAVRQQALELERAESCDGKPAAHRVHVEDRLAELRAEREAFEQERRQEHAERALERHAGSFRPLSREEPQPADERESFGGKVADVLPVDDRAVTGEADDRPKADAAGEKGLAHEPVGAWACRPGSEASAAPFEEASSEGEVDLQVPTRRGELTASPPESGSTPSASEVYAAPMSPSAAGPSSAAPAASEDESIEQYMTRLMARVRGITATPEEPARPSHTTKEEERPEAAAEPEEFKVQPVAKAALTAIPVRPRPEQRTDLSAMRELANLNARSALDTHTRQRLTRVARDKLVVVAMAVLFGCVGVALGFLHPLAWVGAGMCLLVALAWAAQSVQFARRAAECAAAPDAACPDGDTGSAPAPAGTGPVTPEVRVSNDEGRSGAADLAGADAALPPSA
jgi:hypothetical protein